MEFLQQRVESWIRDQRARILKVTWPMTNGREQRKRIHQEYQRRKKQIHHLCLAVKAESVSDLQDILCAMVLSECVYKRPAAELVRAVNKFKADFDSQIVSLERVQPSSDHVPHRYLLAEAGDALFASFIGTKQYKDVMVDANILQGAIFHEDSVEDTDAVENTEHVRVDTQRKNVKDPPKSTEPKPKQVKSLPKPAAHRGFMARAKGIPALELYRLAQKKKRKLVLCGHSLGGAVAVLATLAILRVVAASSKEYDKVQVKCITFSQPPVGNAALRDYVNGKGWQQYFKTFCIPEDLVPRILSPAYFHHYNAQSLHVPGDFSPSIALLSKRKEGFDKPKSEKLKENEGEQLVLGLGPVQDSFWRLSRLVPLQAVRRQLNRYKRNKVDPSEVSSSTEPTVSSSIEDVVSTPQSLEIQEDSDGISLKPLSDKRDLGEKRNDKSSTKDNTSSGNSNAWRRVPSLPSYVPFGQLYILGSSSVESLSSAEYSKLTSAYSG